MKHTMQYLEWEFEIVKQDGNLVAFCKNPEGENWRSPPCDTAVSLRGRVDKYLLWEREVFSDRHGQERKAFRKKFLAFAKKMKENK